MGVREILRKIGVEVSDSHIPLVRKWRRTYENDLSRNYDLVAQYSKGSNKCAVAEDSSRKLHRKKYSYKAHIQACKKWAALFFNEKTKLFVDELYADSFAAELTFLEKYYESSGLWPLLEENFAEIFGMGTMAVVTEYSSKYGVTHKWYAPEAVFPMEIHQGRMRSVVFVSEIEEGKDKYTLYNIHREQIKTDVVASGVGGVHSFPAGTAGYTVQNMTTKKGSAEIVDSALFGLEANYESPVRLFSVFKPFNRKLNNFNSAFGIPIYYDHEDMLAEIDNIYDGKHVDMETSTRAVFINKDALTYDAEGRSNIPQRLHATIISTAALDGFGGEQKTAPITEFSPEPNTPLYSTELQAALNRFSSAIGLGTEAFKLERGQIATATQIVSEAQEKYANLKKHIGIMTHEFAALNKAILAVVAQNEKRPFNVQAEIGFFIQDSVVVNDEVRREIAMTEVRDNLRSVQNYLEEFRGLSGDELEKELDLIQEGTGGDMDEITGLLRAEQDKPTDKKKPKDDESEDA